MDSFDADEVVVALELIDGAISNPEVSGYSAIVAVDDDDDDCPVVGYICFGRTPMTVAAWDLYWVAVDSDFRGSGVGRALVEKFEDHVRDTGGGVIRVETSTQEGYGRARAFYERAGYDRVGTIRGFYKPDDDLLIFAKWV